MARKAEEEANHWPGFVDALSTIVMVITFLLILLGLTLFIMMQKIREDANVSIAEQVTAMTKGGNDTVNEDQVDPQLQNASSSASKNAAVAELEMKLEQAQKEIEALKTQTKQTAGAPKAPEGQSVPALQSDLRQNEVIDTEDKLTIITQKVDEKVKVKVSPDQLDPVDGNIEVTSAAIALEIDYDETTTKLSKEAGDQVGDFFNEKYANDPNAKFEIRSIGSSKIGSVSEARRKAYFRALSVRNVLLKRGIPANRIITRVSMPQPGESDDKVIVALKPS